jgi:SAM-dependent methyltransferase
VSEQVRELFDKKAADWPGKYAAGGRLSGRLSQLGAAAAELIAANGELLDLGCGSGELARLLGAEGYQVTGCDIAPLMLRQAEAADPGHAVRWVRLDPGWRELPFTAGCLDAVIAASVLEYVRNPAAVLAECARVLRPGGVLLCTVPSAAHPVRWLEWPLRLAASIPLAGIARHTGPRGEQYLTYLRTSRQRHRVRWWYAQGRRAGLAGVMPCPAAREPLRLIAFTRCADVTDQPIQNLGDQ